MEITVEPNKMYAVTTSGSCTVIDADGLELCTASSGQQSFFVATTSTVTISDDSAKVSRANFKHAPAALGLLGGGDKLPAGYTRAEFLESTGTQKIVISELKVNRSDEISWKQKWIRYIGSTGIDGVWQIGTESDARFYSWKKGDFCGVVFFGKIWNGKSTDFENKSFFKANESSFEVDGVSYALINEFTSLERSGVRLFEQVIKGVTYPSSVRLFTWEVKRKCKLIPSLDSSGVPCMYDKVTRKPFYNSGTGSFIVGMTLEQARKLSKLPSTGGTLTVSLPSNYQEDEGVVNALAKAQENGWVITLQTHETEAGAASTFALRRVWVRKRTDEQGSYIDADGSRWQVEWCVDVIGADPETLGYERFRSVDAATEYWELTPFMTIEPETEPEELSTIE